jgi:hypothetical protein
MYSFGAWLAVARAARIAGSSYVHCLVYSLDGTSQVEVAARCINVGIGSQCVTDVVRCCDGKHGASWLVEFMVCFVCAQACMHA